MKELKKFIEWYLSFGGDISEIDMAELKRLKFADYD